VEKKVPVELTIVENRKSYSRWHEIMATGKYVSDRCGLACDALNYRPMHSHGSVYFSIRTCLCRHDALWSTVLGINVDRGMVIRDMETILVVSLQILGVPIYFHRRFIHACHKAAGMQCQSTDARQRTDVRAPLSFACRALFRIAAHHIVLLDSSDKDVIAPTKVDAEKICMAADPARAARRTVGLVNPQLSGVLWITDCLMRSCVSLP